LKRIAELNNKRDRLRTSGRVFELIDVLRTCVSLVERSIIRTISAKTIYSYMWCKK
jgi:hypothetical protein